MFRGIIRKVRGSYLDFNQKVAAYRYAPSRTQMQITLFVLGITLLTTGLIHSAQAQLDNFGDDIAYSDGRIAGALSKLLAYLEGSFGALVMVAAGIGAILSSAFGQYRAALGCLIIAVGAFILRSIMSSFFNTETIEQVVET